MNEPDPRGARRDPRREGCRQCCAPAARPRAADQSAPTADPHQVQQLDSKPGHQLDHGRRRDQLPGHQLDPWQRGRPLATVLTRCSLAAIGQACSSIRCSDSASISARFYRSTSTNSRANNKADDQGRRKKERFINLFLFSFCSRCSRSVPVLFPSSSTAHRNPETQQIRGFQPDSAPLFPLFPFDFAKSAGLAALKPIQNGSIGCIRFALLPLFGAN